MSGIEAYQRSMRGITLPWWHDYMGKSEQNQIDRLKLPGAGDIVDGRYRVESMLGRGGMGVVLRAEHLASGRPVALKLLPPQVAGDKPRVAERFAREVRLASQLSHPNTIRLLDYGESPAGVLYVAMELLEGRDLKEVIARQGPLSLGRAVDICLQMLDGLAEAHALGFIHRDLKPSNVFICAGPDGQEQVKLVDFGIAKTLSEAGDELTASGAICGTPSYVAPEYLLREKPRESADVYAVGLILLEMITGRRVFDGGSAMDTMMMQLERRPQIPAAIAHTRLGHVVRRAVAKAPEQRWPDAGSMRRALSEAADGVAGEWVLGAPGAYAEAGDEERRRRAEADTVVGLDAPLDAVECPSDLAMPAALDISAPVLATDERRADRRAGREAAWRAAFLAGIVVLVAVLGGLAVVWIAAWR